MQRVALWVMAVFLATLLSPPAAPAQGPTPEVARAMLRLDPPRDPGVASPGVMAYSAASIRPAEPGRDHTVTGLLIGAGLGFVGAWAFYDTICEAVDNKCSPSRPRYLVTGTALGAGIGALFGALTS